MNQAVGYIRCSTVDQLTRDGPLRQRAAIESYAKEHGYNLIHCYEEGVSGSDYVRPALAKLMIDSQENGWRTVIIERLDRLARDIMVSEAIIRDFQTAGIHLISTTEGRNLGSNEPTRKFIRQILSATAEFDKSITNSKLRAARDRKSAELGRRCEGRKPVYPKKLRTRIKHLHTKGWSYASISRHFNEEKVKTSNGHDWTGQLVRTVAMKGAMQC